MRKSRPWAGLAKRYGTLGEAAVWKQVQEHYYWDRMEAALDMAQSLGTGSNAQMVFFYRLIEAEAVTRQRSQRHEPGDWFRLEWIPSEVDISIDELESAIREECAKVLEILPWEQSDETLFTLLAVESNAPWTPGRQGFFMDKFPYDKICLPSELLQDESEFRSAVRHEYAHAATLNLAEGRCPRWLDEAIAMVVSGEAFRLSPAEFVRQSHPWQSPNSLDQAYLADRESAQGRPVVWSAYYQSAMIGAWIAESFGIEAFSRLLAGMTNNSVWSDLVARFRNREAVDEAMLEVTGMSTARAFESAKTWTLANSPV